MTYNQHVINTKYIKHIHKGLKMNNYEFISYKQYNQDPYTTASCKIRIDKRFVVNYFQKKTKDGGLFWTPASAQIMGDDGQKQYITGFMLDSQMESEMLIDFIKENVRLATSARTPMQGSAFTPSGATTSMNAMKEVAEEQPLPF